MHILFYSNWYIKQTLQLANALAAEHRVTLIFPETSPELNAYDGRIACLQEILEPGVALVTFPHMQNFDLLGWIPALKAVRIIRTRKPDVVHLNESYDFRCLLLMMLCPGSIFVTSVHDPVPHSSEKKSLPKFKYWVRDQIRRRSQGLVVHGENLREVLADYSKLPIDKTHFVPHGEYRYYHHFDKPADRKENNGHKKALFFGCWEDYKGIDVLVDAEPLITARIPDARIVLAGKGKLRLCDLQPRMVHPENFEIRNYAIPDQEVPQLFRDADVVVLPYREATQSGPLHIAGTFARPAVVSRVGAMPEIIKDGQTGILVSPGDPRELADAVCHLLEHPDEARRMGENARKYMTESSSMERVAKIQADVYQKVISACQERS